MTDWYNVNKVVPSNNRTVLVQYVHPDRGRTFIGVAKYKENGYTDYNGESRDWSVNRVAESNDEYMTNGTRTVLNACSGQNWGGDGYPLQVIAWKEIYS